MSGRLALPGIEAIRPIDYGERLRLGLILPSGNVIAEPQIRAMLPPGVGFYVTRLALRGTSPAELLHMIDGVEAAAMLLADARVDAIVFHCTAVTTFSPTSGAAIRQRIEAATGIPGIVTSDALAAAFAALSLRRVTLLTPYTQPTHQREIDFVRQLGIAVVSDATLDLETNEDMARVRPGALADWVLAHRDDRAGGIFPELHRVAHSGADRTVGAPSGKANPHQQPGDGLAHAAPSARGHGDGRLWAAYETLSVYACTAECISWKVMVFLVVVSWLPERSTEEIMVSLMRRRYGIRKADQSLQQINFGPYRFKLHAAKPICNPETARQRRAATEARRSAPAACHPKFRVAGLGTQCRRASQPRRREALRSAATRTRPRSPATGPGRGARVRSGGCR
jgi:maleate cis-trans isomerase